MVTSLIKHERIQTTLPKAKELKYLADQVVGWGKDGTSPLFLSQVWEDEEIPCCFARYQ